MKFIFLLFIGTLIGWSNTSQSQTDPTCVYTNRERNLHLLDSLITATEEQEEKESLIYEKSVLQLKSGQYYAAYTTGLSCTGKSEKDGTYIAAKSVAALANSCGESTFERKCNFIYAAQLAEEAGQSSAAAYYRASGPKQGSCDESDKKPVQLNCWGITVNVCDHL
ncbi:MAG: hypothetical protein HWE22_14790 [Flavobacteriales bacterium]|nr:hypothetical protein [Flavobacteriales bacterium]